MKKTRGGVYHNLEYSTYFYIIDDITFYFSSEYNRNRFVRDYKKERLKIDKSLSNRFDVDINTSILADLRLYRDVEKRGFHVLKGGEVLCEENLELDIVLETKRS